MLNQKHVAKKTHSNLPQKTEFCAKIDEILVEIRAIREIQEDLRKHLETKLAITP